MHVNGNQKYMIIKLPGWLQAFDYCCGVRGHGEEWQPCARLSFRHDDDSARPRWTKQ